MRRLKDVIDAGVHLTDWTLWYKSQFFRYPPVSYCNHHFLNNPGSAPGKEMKPYVSGGLLASLFWGSWASAQSGTCNATSDCVSGCCSTSGYCGFGPSFCGDDVCVSSCDALAECGPYAEVANTTCPLNVCCSPFGFCGTTEEFCGTDCQSHCGAVTEPSCSGTSSDARYIGYYEAWNYQHPCDNILPSNIDVEPWTHLYYAFAGINSQSSEIETVYPNDDMYIPDFIALKKKKSTLKTFISVGGWDLGGEIFSDMTSFSGSRSAFVTSVVSFMDKWGFDGVDIDWEYPAASDRGGKDADTANLVTLLKELKAACGESYGISVTLPSSYWYLKGFDIASMADYVDWFNFMAYDIHGTWDGTVSNWTSSDVNPHTNLTEISDGLDLLWRNDIDPGKVLLGLGFYGRSFTLADSSCDTPGCGFDASAYGSGGAAPGECTRTSGILSDYEISRIISEYNPTVVYSETAGVNWMTWNEKEWVSFDNGKTLKQKADFANSRCLGGLFSWALDLGGPGSLENPNAMSASDTSMDGASTDGGSDGTGDLYVGQEIFDNHTVVGVGPINMIFPPSTLDSLTTIQPEPFVTSIEVAWTTTETVTISETVVPTTTITRVIVTTTITLDPIITSEIPYWNWNITTANQTTGTAVLFPSLPIGSVIITDKLDFVTQTSNYSSRTLLVPPWPWSTTSLPTTVPTGPTIHFIQGDPPSPTCTAGCGTKCETFCEAPCMDNCDVGGGESSGFDDPSDPDPPSNQRCSGPDCVNGKCAGPLCVVFGCSGADCDESSGTCLGSDCEETGCMGDGCSSKGSCTSDPCQTVGCTGDDCNGSGLCFGLQCISLGCIGLLCDKSTGSCSGSNCHKVSCSGPNCDDGVCTGKGCTGEDDDCEEEEVGICTEFVYSTLDSDASTYATETTTSCDTITACYAEATTTTSTLSDDGTGTTAFIAYAFETDAAVASSVADDIDADFESAISEWESTSTTTTTTTTKSTTTTTSKTTTGPAATSTLNTSPDEVSYSCHGMSGECGIFVGLHSFCNVAKSYIRGNQIYGTTDDNAKTGECYTDNVSGGFGCGIFVKGDGCQLEGSVMQAAYDHVLDSGCEICGQVEFSNGCHMRVDYVSGCTTQNDGPAHFVSFDDGSTGSAGSANSTALTLMSSLNPASSSSATSSWTTSTSEYAASTEGVFSSSAA
ncbi:hypothetical protein BJX99DRAFT_270507 [Aspergillus californicus]